LRLRINVVRFATILATLLFFSMAMAVPAHAVLKVKDTAANKAAFLTLLEAYTGWDLDFADDGETVKKALIPGAPIEKPSIHDLVGDIIDSPQTVEITVGRSQPDVVIDAFEGDGKGEVDLDDFDALPEPAAGANAVSKAEALAHVLGEYFNAAQNTQICVNEFDARLGRVDHWDMDDDYYDSHYYAGIPEQNEVRAHNGAAGEKRIPGATIRNGVVEIPFFDGEGQEVYRERWKLKDSNIDKIESIEFVMIVPMYTPRLLRFRGKVTEVLPAPPAYSGSIFMTQQVRYENITVLSGSYGYPYIIVDHIIVQGSRNVDPNLPRLNPSIFYLSSELIVEAEEIIDPVTGNFMYVELEVSKPAVGGIALPVDKFALLAPWIILATIITIATVSVVAYWRRRQQKA